MAATGAQGKKLAIMQPYFFPYLGYWQLMQATDTFVLYDDVNYIKQGWINRNHILLNHKKQLFTLQVSGASSFRKINEVAVGNNTDKLLKTVHQAYHKAPGYRAAFPVIAGILNNRERNLARFLEFAIRETAAFLGIGTTILVSSKLEKENTLSGQEKILDICGRLKAGRYINAVGGRELYDRDAFARRGITLSFLQSEPVSYPQSGRDFLPGLSIIDLMMFNRREALRELLARYTLV